MIENKREQFLLAVGEWRVEVNSNMLITNIIGKNAQWLCVSSTSASQFEFIELPIGTGSTQFSPHVNMVVK